MLLPYLDQTALYAKWNFDLGQDHSTNRPANSTPVTVFFCPSRPRPTRNDSTNAYGDYSGSNGTGTTWSQEVSDRKGLFNVNSDIRIRDITDGLSNTIAVGEKRVTQPGTSTGPQYRVGWNSIRNMNHKMNVDVSPFDDNNANFGSDHTGGAHFLMADGAVVFLSENIDLTLYQNLGNRADGNIASVP